MVDKERLLRIAYFYVVTTVVVVSVVGKRRERIRRRGEEQVGLTETHANKSICRLELDSLTKALVVTGHPVSLEAPRYFP